MENKLTNTQIENIFNDFNISNDPETEGFDLQAGQSWIYPTNYPMRDYQYNIIQEALHKNTLVSLPTGLGKTFIAAVVMYNFFRWYPHSKLIFMAPTKPLVKQQIDACYNIMAIPPEVTAELTGTNQHTSRVEIWKNKRVFFITPHILQNDLQTILELGPKIKLLVFDEAHKAKGNYAYCEVIRKLLPQTKLFRVLALSATPGNYVKDVLEVIQNLLISHLEFRTEESLDVKPYVFDRSLETVVVQLGDKLQEVRDNYIQILETYTRTLVKYKVIHGNCSNLTKGKIFLVMKEFQERNQVPRDSNHSEIMRSLNICVTLYHAFDLLIRHGLRSFLNFFEEHIDKPLLKGNVALIQIMEDIRNYLGPAPNIEPLPDGTFSKIPSNTKFGHPKYYQLRDILLSHFTESSNDSTRVIVFFEYRESVMEAYSLLLQSTPMIKPRLFLGQGSGITQKVQINVLKSFREGNCNTLLSTCIGEEGLDVGEVDLIVCFDVSNKSPIRMIQRMGRTGRKREGRIIVFVTEGKEQETLKECLIQKHNLGTFVFGSKELCKGMYSECPRMIPLNIKPKCEKMFITVRKQVLKKNGSLKDIFRNISKTATTTTTTVTSSACCDNDDDDIIVNVPREKLPKRKQFWNKVNPLSTELDKRQNIFNRNLEKQRTSQPVALVKHSKKSQALVSLLQFADSKRFNIPLTQVPNAFSQISQNLKQADIRSMFSLNFDADFKVPETQIINKMKVINDFNKEKSLELDREISDYLLINFSLDNKCKICSELFECPKIIYQKESVSLKDWIQPDISIIDTITVEDLNFFADSLSPESKELYLEFNDSEMNESIFDNIQFTQIEKEQVNEQSFSYKTPKSFSKILNTYNNISTSSTQEEIKIIKSSLEHQQSKSTDDSKEILLAFFNLEKLEDLFANKSEEKLSVGDTTIIYSLEPELSTTDNKNQLLSPDIFDDASPEAEVNTSPIIISSSSGKKGGGGSPILCTFDRVQQLKMKAKKKLFEKFQADSCDNNLGNVKELKQSTTNNNKLINLSILKSPPSKCFDWKRDRDENSDIAANSVKVFSSPKLEEKKLPDVSSKKIEDIDISDICDLSVFGLSNSWINKVEAKTDYLSSTETVPKSDDLNISDLCNSSIFGISNNKKIASTASDVDVNEGIDLNKSIDIGDACDLSVFGISNNKKIAITASDVDVNKGIDLNKSVDIGDFWDLSVFNIDKNMKDSFKQSTASSTNTVDNFKRDASKSLDNIKSDCETDSVKNKTLSQLTITQMLSQIAKSDAKSQTQSKVNKINNSNNQKKVLTSTTNFNTNNNINLTINSNSDDEFEKTQPLVWIKPKQIIRKTPKKPKKSLSLNPVNKKRKKFRSDFIEEEAQLSEDENVFVSQDEDDNDDNDCYEASFVSDATQDLISTQMHVKYLQSVRSPRVGRFKIPEHPKREIMDVYSQEVNNEDNSYVNDSFCVNTEDVDFSEQSMLSELELLELKLKDMNKKKKKRKKPEDGGYSKKRRIITIISSDNSD